MPWSSTPPPAIVGNAPRTNCALATLPISIFVVGWRLLAAAAHRPTPTGAAPRFWPERAVAYWSVCSPHWRWCWVPSAILRRDVFGGAAPPWSFPSAFQQPIAYRLTDHRGRCRSSAAGGVFAGVIGPQLVDHESVAHLTSSPGTYLAQTVVATLSAAVLSGVRPRCRLGSIHGRRPS